jgi:hypothetical protein
VLHVLRFAEEDHAEADGDRQHCVLGDVEGHDLCALSGDSLLNSQENQLSKLSPDRNYSFMLIQ